MQRLSRFAGIALFVPFILISATVAFSEEPNNKSDAPLVGIKFDSGKTELAQMKEGAAIFANKHYTIAHIPPEISGLTFTLRAGGHPATVQLDIAAGATLYLLVDSDKGANARKQLLQTEGWTRLADAEYPVKNKHPYLAVYRQKFTQAENLTMTDGGWSGIIVVSANLELASGDSAPPAKKKNGGGSPSKKEPQAPADTTPAPYPDPAPDTKPMEGPTTRASQPQASIKSLEVYTESSGLMVGQVSEVVLTVTRGNDSHLTTVQFVQSIGDEMRAARDEALRYIHLNYPNWYVDKAEISFEDKYVAHDGGSIGAAVGTMILSVIRGVQIDPNLAITGDISANGKIRAIGGLSAKLHGAIIGDCNLVAIPTENYEQLVDAVVYNGPDIVQNIQVIGISSLDDAVATARIDRDPKLAKAIAQFAEIQKSIKANPDYLTKDKTAPDKLAAVLTLAPQHLSAKILLSIAQGTMPKTLSPVASIYYTDVAVNPMMDILKERDTSNSESAPSTAVAAGLRTLKALRIEADPAIRPLIDNWMSFIAAWYQVQSGSGSSQLLEARRQALLDEIAKEQANADLDQKMIKEGV